MLVCMENVFIDHNLQNNPPAVRFCPSNLAASGWSSITRNAVSGTGRLLERERKMFNKGPEEFYQAPKNFTRPPRILPGPQEFYQAPRILPGPQEFYQAPKNFTRPPRILPGPQEFYQAPKNFTRPPRILPGPQEFYQAPKILSPALKILQRLNCRFAA